MELLLDNPKRDWYALALVYSMSDFWVGLVGQLLSYPWEMSWSENFQKVTVSRNLDRTYDGKKIVIVLNFQ